MTIKISGDGAIGGDRTSDNPFLKALHYAACVVLSPFGYRADRSSPSQRARTLAEERAAKACPSKIDIIDGKPRYRMHE